MLTFIINEHTKKDGQSAETQHSDEQETIFQQPGQMSASPTGDRPESKSSPSGTDNEAPAISNLYTDICSPFLHPTGSIGPSPFGSPAICENKLGGSSKESSETVPKPVKPLRKPSRHKYNSPMGGGIIDPCLYPVREPILLDSDEGPQNTSS